jgi:nucleoside-diphosphate-sugar epimerase
MLNVEFKYILLNVLKMHGCVKMEKEKNVTLVAGGAGFIGSNLCRLLLDRGHYVDAVDDLSTGRIGNIADLISHPRFSFIQADVADTDICSSLRGRHYTQVYHLACPTGVPNIALLGEQMFLASSAGTLNLLRIAKRSGAKFLFASTAEIYGDPEIFPQPESYAGNVDPVGPRSAYEEAKRYGEALTRFYGRSHGVETRIVRIFNTYGSNMSPVDQRVIPQMFARLTAGQPVVIFGDGSQTRTFLHVDDLLAGFLLVMDRGERGEVYNIGGSTQITVRGLFELVKLATGLAGTAVYQEHFIEDHRGRWPDTTKIEALGWRQRIPLSEGVRRSYEEFVRDMTAGSSAHVAANINTPTLSPNLDLTDFQSDERALQ